MQFIAVPVVIAIVSYAIYRLFELFVRRNERMLLIEKLTELRELKGLPLELPNFSPRLNLPFTALRVGLALLGVGFGLLLGTFLSVYCIPVEESAVHSVYVLRDAQDLLIAASAAMMGGLGLAVSYIIEKKHYFKERDRM